MRKAKRPEDIYIPEGIVLNANALSVPAGVELRPLGSPQHDCTSGISDEDAQDRERMTKIADDLKGFDLEALPPFEVSGLVEGRMIWYMQSPDELDPRQEPTGRGPARRCLSSRIALGASIRLCDLALLFVRLANRLSSPRRASS